MIKVTRWQALVMAASSGFDVAREMYKVLLAANQSGAKKATFTVKRSVTVEE